MEGVRQGCTLSPLLFNQYNEAMIRKALTDVDNGVGGYMVKSVRIADDKATVVRSETGLQELLDTHRILNQVYSATVDKITSA